MEREGLPGCQGTYDRGLSWKAQGRRKEDPFGKSHKVDTDFPQEGVSESCLEMIRGKARKYPDGIGQWPVDMLVDVDAKELKTTFLSLAHEIMDKIKKAR